MSAAGHSSTVPLDPFSCWIRSDNIVITDLIYRLGKKCRCGVCFLAKHPANPDDPATPADPQRVVEHKLKGSCLRESCLKIVESKGAWGYMRGLDWHVMVLGFSQLGKGHAPWICPADQQLNEATWQAQQHAALGLAATPQQQQQQQQQREQLREQARQQLEGVSAAEQRQQPPPPPAQQQQSEQQQGGRDAQQLEEEAAPQSEGAQVMHGLEFDGENLIKLWDMVGRNSSAAGSRLLSAALDTTVRIWDLGSFNYGDAHTEALGGDAGR